MGGSRHVANDIPAQNTAHPLSRPAKTPPAPYARHPPARGAPWAGRRLPPAASPRAHATGPRRSWCLRGPSSQPACGPGSSGSAINACKPEIAAAAKMSCALRICRPASASCNWRRFARGPARAIGGKHDSSLTIAAPISSRSEVLKCRRARRPRAAPQKEASSVKALTRPSSLKPTTRPVPALDFWTYHGNDDQSKTQCASVKAGRARCRGRMGPESWP
jgi:hypothetical protein